MKTETNQNTNQGHEANTLLAVSGLPSQSWQELLERINYLVNVMKMRNEKLPPEVNEIQTLIHQYSIVHEALKAACASGAAGTVAEGRYCDYCKGSGYDPYPNHDTTQRPCQKCEAPYGGQP